MKNLLFGKKIAIINNNGEIFRSFLLLLLLISCSKNIEASGEQEKMAKPENELLHKVTKENGTEPAFRNAYWDNKRPGLYVDPYDGTVLFTSNHKYVSGTGWPSFYKTLNPTNIEKKSDFSFGMKREEVRSRSSDSHLGHLFGDGPPPTSQRYCLNSAALRFVPQEDLDKEGLTDYRVLFEENPQQGTRDNAHFASAIFAGGCFWCTESAFEAIEEGVVKVLSGYTGGNVPNPSYEQVTSGSTGHYEGILVLYQPEFISYETLLRMFWRQIDPTDGAGQFYDRGKQYRTAVFYRTEKERLAAEQSKAELRVQGIFGDAEIVTEILPEQEFYLAEDYHQDYSVKNPQRYQNYVSGSGRKYFLQSAWNEYIRK